MPQKKRSSGRRTEPKLFRCTGFGECDMVFTRSEHLARHARKHTGEKPFKCVVPNCDRMFSRFDNMMQHTHTHNRIKKKEDKSEKNKKQLTLNHSTVSSASSSMPATPNIEINHHLDLHPILPGPPPHSSSDRRLISTPPFYYNSCLPPLSPVKSQFSDDHLNYHKQQQEQHHLYYNQHQQQLYTPRHSAPTTPSHHLSIHPTPTSSIYSLSPEPKSRQLSPITDYFGNHEQKTTISVSHKKMPSIELSTPIKELPEIYSDSTTSTDDEDNINITSDEFEALQGFGKFCSEPIVREPILTLPTDKKCISPAAILSNHHSLHSKVYAFRQQLTPTHESFQRHHYFAK